MYNSILPDEVQQRILENQETIMLALSKILLTAGQSTSEKRAVINELIDNYHLTHKLLGKDYIER